MLGEAGKKEDDEAYIREIDEEEKYVKVTVGSGLKTVKYSDVNPYKNLREGDHIKVSQIGKTSYHCTYAWFNFTMLFTVM